MGCTARGRDWGRGWGRGCALRPPYCQRPCLALRVRLKRTSEPSFAAPRAGERLLRVQAQLLSRLSPCSVTVTQAGCPGSLSLSLPGPRAPGPGEPSALPARPAARPGRPSRAGCAPSAVWVPWELPGSVIDTFIALQLLSHPGGCRFLASPCLWCRVQQVALER